MIRIGIYGYGNLARGVEAAIKMNDDMKLVAVFTRRDPSTVRVNTKDVTVAKADDVLKYKLVVNYSKIHQCSHTH